MKAHVQYSSRSFILLAIGAVVIVGIGTLLIGESFSDRGTLITRITLIDLPPDEQITLTIATIDLWHPERGWRTIDDRERILSTENSDSMQLTLERPVRTGAYDRVRVVFARIDRITSDDEREPLHTLLNTVVMHTPSTVTSEAPSALLISLPLGESLYALGASRSIFIPRLRVESRAGVTTARENGGVTITGGSLLMNQTFGMTADGSMRAQYRLPKDTEFALEPGGLRILSLPAALTPVERIERMLAEEERGEQSDTNTSATTTQERVDPQDYQDNVNDVRSSADASPMEE